MTVEFTDSEPCDHWTIMEGPCDDSPTSKVGESHLCEDHYEVPESTLEYWRALPIEPGDAIRVLRKKAGFVEGTFCGFAPHHSTDGIQILLLNEGRSTIRRFTVYHTKRGTKIARRIEKKVWETVHSNE